MDTSVRMKRVADAIALVRAPATPGEYDLHGMIADAFDAAGLTYQHELPIAPRCRIDFAVARVGVEVKKGRPSPTALRAQLARYLASDALDAIIVVSQRAVSLPSRINGKPVLLISLNRLWGIALP